MAVAQAAADMGVRVFTIGIGSKEGTFIPLPDGGYITDEDGNNVMTRLDDATLQEIAAVGNGLYVQSSTREFGLNPIIEEIQNMEDEVMTSVVYEEYEELYMYFLGVALLFFVIEMLVGDRRSRIHLFKR